MKVMNVINIKKSLLLFSIMMISMSFQFSQHDTLLPGFGVNAAIASDINFESKIDQLEDRAKMLRVVIKKMARTFKKAKKNHEFLVENGMDQKDIDRLESAFKKKIQHMIDEAIAEISNI